MVLFDVIAIDDIKEFGVIIAPLVALVSAATGFYFAIKGNQGQLKAPRPPSRHRSVRRGNSCGGAVQVATAPPRSPPPPLGR